MEDKSKDRTALLIENFIEKFNSRFHNIIFIRNDVNTGNIAQNCNCMIKKATGKYIKLFSGDDLMAPDCIKKLVDYLEVNPNDIMVYANGYIIPDSYKMEDREEKSLLVHYKHHKPFAQNKIFTSLMMGNYILAPTVLIRASAYKQYGYHDEKIRFEDFEYWLRLSKNEHFGYFNENVIYYRIAPNSLSNFSNKADTERFRKLIREERKVLGKYLKNMNTEQRKIYVTSFYNRMIKMAIEMQCYKVVLELLIEMKKKKIKVPKIVWERLFQSFIRKISVGGKLHADC
jgi:GT2 family glycosyltransferase